jgi:hypothetical protein
VLIANTSSEGGGTCTVGPDAAGNTWTAIGTPQTFDGLEVQQFVVLSSIASVGSNDVPFSCSGSPTRTQMQLLEYHPRGTATLESTVVAPETYCGGGQSNTSPSFTVSPDDLIIQFGAGGTSFPSPPTSVTPGLQVRSEGVKSNGYYVYADGYASGTSLTLYQNWPNSVWVAGCGIIGSAFKSTP